MTVTVIESDIPNTRIRYVSSKTMEGIIGYFNNLHYRVELKSLVWDGKLYIQTFVLPDKKDLKEVPSGRINI